MAVPPLDVSSLEIIGYADVLTEDLRPAVVPPVFRRRDAPFSILVPPYTFNNGRYVCDATEISPAELDTLESRREVTRLPSVFAAARDHELWIGRTGDVHYEPRREARRHLEAIAKEAIEKARRAFVSRIFDEAERESSIAILADHRSLDALAIKIAVATARGNDSEKRVLLGLAQPGAQSALRLLVDNLSPSLVPRKAPSPVMRGIAKVRSPSSYAFA